MAAGDINYSLESISVDSEGRVVLAVSNSVAGQGSARHKLRPVALTFTANTAQLAQISALRNSILASLAASPPPDLAGTHVAPTTREERKAEREAARAAARAARG